MEKCLLHYLFEFSVFVEFFQFYFAGEFKDFKLEKDLTTEITQFLN